MISWQKILEILFIWGMVVVYSFCFSSYQYKKGRNIYIERLNKILDDRKIVYSDEEIVIIRKKK